MHSGKLLLSFRGENVRGSQLAQIFFMHENYLLYGVFEDMTRRDSILTEYATS